MNLGSRKEGFYMSHARKPYAELSNASLKDQEHLGSVGRTEGACTCPSVGRDIFESCFENSRTTVLSSSKLLESKSLSNGHSSRHDFDKLSPEKSSVLARQQYGQRAGQFF